jgi:hypothetical protein
VDTFEIKSGDVEPPLDVTLLSDTEPVDLSGIVGVRLRTRATEGGPILIDSPMTVVDAANGLVRYEWQAGDTDVVGEFYAEYVVTWTEGEQTFPDDGYHLIDVNPGLDATTSDLPALPDSCWPVDESACPEFSDYSPHIKALAKAYAGESLRLLTGFRVGGCPITVRPCSIACVSTSSAWFQYGAGWAPYINSAGVWVNGCCGANDCGHLGTAAITLPGPVGEVTEVLVDGVVVDPSLYRVDNGSQLIRLDGNPWPTTQDMLLAPTEAGTFAVTYLRGVPVDGMGARAAGVLACEFGRALSGLNCALPTSVTSITRQGVSMTLEVGAFPGGVTGIREVDIYIERWNPGHLRAATKIWSPDLVNPRATTWVSP